MSRGPFFSGVSGILSYIPRSTSPRYLGARLIKSNGLEFWMTYQDDDKRKQAVEFWTGIVQAGGDEGTDDSLLKRIRMLEKAKMWDPQD